MNVKLRVLSAGVLFFIGHAVSAQKAKNDTIRGEIDEVVVTGYNKQKKDEISQAVSIVSGEELRAMAPSGSVVNMLQGKASGLQVVNNSGKPGDGGSIRVRGAINVSTTLGASDPLFVVDGIYMTQRQFNVINSNDIESITVLKDAAAAAQYGSRGGNGVILVTTKRGKSGKARISFETKMGFGQKVKDKNFTMMNAAEKLAYEDGLSSLVSVPDHTGSTNAELIALNHDWQKDVLRNSALQSYAVTASGGNEKSKYFMSLGHDVDTGILEYLTGFKRYNARFNFDQQLTDRLKVNADFGFNNSRTDDQRYSYNALSPFYAMYALNPYESVYENGVLNGNLSDLNPIDILQSEKTMDNRSRVSGQISAEYKIIDGLKFTSSFGANYDVRKNKYVVRKGSDIASVYGIPNGQIRDTRSDFSTYVFTNRLNYNKVFDRHSVNLTAFTEYSREDFGSLSGTKRVMLNPNVTDISTAVTPFAITGTSTSTRRLAFAGILDYDYGKKYLFSVTGRRDANSRFGMNQKYGNFWGASVAWNIAKEDFLQDVVFLNELKIRGSIGERGNDNSLTDYQNIVSVVTGDYGTNPTLYPNTAVGNPDIAWEKVRSQNLGLEFEMFKNRFKASFELYKDTRKDFLYRLNNLPFESGGNGYTSYVNAGDMVVKGFETELSFDIIKNSNFTWNVRGNLTSQAVKTEKLYANTTDLPSGDGLTFTYIGGEPFTFKLVRFAGVDPNNGDALYYTADGKITNVFKSSDAVYLAGKSPLPSVYGGFGTSFKFKSFDLSADFSYQYGGYSYNQVAMDMLDFSNAATNKRTDAINYWTTPGQNASLPKPVASGLQQSDLFLQKTDFIRFRSLDVGYTFDKNFLGENVFIDNIRVFAQAQNIALWTNFEGDPENAVASETQINNNQFVPGSLQLYNYPPVQTYLLGIQVNF